MCGGVGGGRRRHIAPVLDVNVFWTGIIHLIGNLKVTYEEAVLSADILHWNYFLFEFLSVNNINNRDYCTAIL